MKSSRRRKIVSLAERRLEPVPGVVACLEDWLARAKRGELRGVALVGAADGLADVTGFCIGDGTIAQLVLANRRIEQRLLDWVED